MDPEYTAGVLTPVAESPVAYKENRSKVTNSSNAPRVSMDTSGVNRTPRFKNIPSVSQEQLSRIGTIGQYVPALLADNVTGPLNWPTDPPVPSGNRSTYERLGCIGDGSCLFHALCKGVSQIYMDSYRMCQTITEAKLREFEASATPKGQEVIRLFPDNLFIPRRNHRLSEEEAKSYLYRFASTEAYSQFDNILFHFRLRYVQLIRSDLQTNLFNNPAMQEIVRNRLYGSIEMEADMLSQQVYGDTAPEHVVEVFDQAFRNVLTRLANLAGSQNAVPPDYLLLFGDISNTDIYLLRDADIAAGRMPLYGGDSVHSGVMGPTGGRNAIVLIAVSDNHYEIVVRVDHNLDGSRNITTQYTQEEPLIKKLYGILTSLRS